MNNLELAFLLDLLSGTVVSLETIGGVLSDEGDEVLHFTASVVRHGVLSVALGKPEESGESSNFEHGRNVVGSGVHLSNDDVLLGKLGGQLLILGGEGFAVSAPRSVELDEDVLVRVKDELLVVLGNEHLEVSLLGGNILGLHVGFDLLIKNVLDELLEVHHAEGLVHGVLAAVGVHDNDGLVRVLSVSETGLLDLSSVLLLVRHREVHLALVLLSNLEHAVAPVVGAFGVLDVVDVVVDNNKGTSLELEGIALGADASVSVGLRNEEGLDLVSVVVAVVLELVGVELVVELLGNEDDDIICVSGLLEHFSIGRVSETETITLSIGDLEEAVLQLRLGEKQTENGIVLLADELLVLLEGSDLLGGRTGLSTHVLDDSIGFAGSVVVLGKLSIAEDLKSGISGNAELLAGVLLDSTVNL
ncbi:hypothetical protein PMAYCL1PPCAC_23391 [Pristionchus mayeri]|uniref:Ribosomal protein n=1 Tax=Pristionchus mayeri TaxID=1317129 RepID=A0AAN5CY12_9BILA|nr:hypothetical protein PMAYCL1PPCAC_23391 [Pristionchus mayeri]